MNVVFLPKTVFSFYGLMLLVSPVCAAATVPPVYSPSAMSLQVVSGLAVVTALIFALAWCVKKLGTGNFMQQNGLKLLGSMPVGSREKVVLIEVNNTQILLGVTASSVNKLHIVEAPTKSLETDYKDQDEAGSGMENDTSRKMFDPADDDHSRRDFAGYIKKVLINGSGS